jgi:hypothetical protein
LCSCMRVNSVSLIIRVSSATRTRLKYAPSGKIYSWG